MIRWYVDYGKSTLEGLPYVKAEIGIAHPNFDPVSFENDIGILVLIKPVNPSEFW